VSEFAVVLAPGAENDIASAFHWYQERSPAAASAFRAEVFEAIDRLAETSMSWPVNDDGTRKRSLRRFPYSVWFEVQGNTVTVIAGAHHRRRPAYWRQ